MLVKLDNGTDVTTMLGIKKYEPSIPANLGGQIIGYRPFWVPKTDEERVQNLVKELEEYQGMLFYVTEKLDGSSMSVYIHDGIFGVCSRNLDLKESEGNTHWRVAKEMDLENKLRSLNCNITIQGELIGEGIQKNPYKLQGQTFKMFNAFNPDTYKFYNFKQLGTLSDTLNIPRVPLLGELELDHSLDELLTKADGYSIFDSTIPREGIVLRTKNRDRISFKVISNEFALNEE